jgi:trehalose 6-phosphate synthase
MWTEAALQHLIRSKLSGHRFIVVANREPYIHRFTGGGVECVQPASGLATALHPIMQASGGVWIAHGSGDADRFAADRRGRLPVPPHNPRYTLRRVWLTKEQEAGYYYGLANEGLWPLCHIAFTRPVFDPEHWRRYREVNEIFAEAVLEEADNRPGFVFIQDYHFALLPRLIKDRNPNLVVGQFWHIPWPNREIFRAFPWKQELLDGMLGNDLLGFHLRYHCDNFLDTVERGIESRVDYERFDVTRGGKSTLVRPFPISIDFEKHVETAASREVEIEMERWRARIGRFEFLGIGIDRIDYTKGIPDRLQALDRLLETRPEYRGKLVFVQVGVPSRTHIPQYRELNERVRALAGEINRKHERAGWRPIVLISQHCDVARMIALHRLADFCIVNSLHDGMNLVAKEFVASRSEERGALVLSQFTGAAREFDEALLVNPFSLEETAEAMHRAIVMPEAERRWRMRRLRRTVAENNIYRWAGKFIGALVRMESLEVAGAAAPRETDRTFAIANALEAPLTSYEVA